MYRCSICKIEKDISEFYKDKRRKCGIYSSCKKCHCLITSNIKYYNPIKDKEYKKKWREKNPDYHRKYMNSYLKKPKNKVDHNMGFIIWRVLRGNKAHRKWTKLVGYTTEELMKHLEDKFLKGMNWNNYGQWEIDHIKPKSLFNYSGPEDNEFKECWSLSNLQPMWKFDNRSKGNKFILKEL